MSILKTKIILRTRNYLFPSIPLIDTHKYPHKSTNKVLSVCIFVCYSIKQTLLGSIELNFFIMINENPVGRLLNKCPSIKNASNRAFQVVFQFEAYYHLYAELPAIIRHVMANFTANNDLLICTACY